VVVSTIRTTRPRGLETPCGTALPPVLETCFELDKPRGAWGTPEGGLGLETVPPPGLAPEYPMCGCPGLNSAVLHGFQAAWVQSSTAQALPANQPRPRVGQSPTLGLGLWPYRNFYRASLIAHHCL